MIFRVRRCRRSSITTRIRVAVVPVENQRRSARLVKKLRKKLKLKLASVRQKPSASKSRLLIPSRLRQIS